MTQKDDMLIYDSHRVFYKNIFKLLNCDLLWVIKIDNERLKILATDLEILKYYLDEKYYLNDPHINSKGSDKNRSWKASLETICCKDLNKDIFLDNVQKKFHFEEILTIEKKTNKERYLFKFFIKGNRFVFMNKLLNDMPIIKSFINNSIKTLKGVLLKQSSIVIAA